jgi:hypothetical protein
MRWTVAATADAATLAAHPASKHSRARSSYQLGLPIGLPASTAPRLS